MDRDSTEVPVGFDDFNPDKKFVVLFDLTFDKRPGRREEALLSMVWEGPELPRPGDIIHIGGDIVLTIPPAPRWSKHSRYHVWNDGKSVQIDAVLLHVRSPRDFLDRVRKLIETEPEFGSTLHATLHIDAAIEMEESIWAAGG